MAQGKDQREQRVGPPQPISSQYGCGPGAKEATPPWNFPSRMGSREDAFLCSLQPTLKSSRGRESRVTGGVCRKEIRGLGGPGGQGEPRFLSSWTNAGRKQGAEVKGGASSPFPSKRGLSAERCLQNRYLKLKNQTKTKTSPSMISSFTFCSSFLTSSSSSWK